MAQVLVTIVKSKDTKGNDVAECFPHNVCLSISAADTVVWGSLEGDFIVKLAPGTAPLLNGGPWAGQKGGLSNPATIASAAKPGDFCNVVSELTLPGASGPLGLGGSIMNTK